MRPTLATARRATISCCSIAASTSATSLGRTAYANAHLPGAFYCISIAIISAPSPPPVAGIRCPDPDAFAKRMGRLASAPAHKWSRTIRAMAHTAARLWVVAALDRLARRRPCSMRLRRLAPAGLPLESTVHPRSARAAGRGELTTRGRDRARQRPAPPTAKSAGGCARRGAVCAGRNESLDPVAGHVPGRKNHPFSPTWARMEIFSLPQNCGRRCLLRATWINNRRRR